VPLPDLSWWPFWRYQPHHNILWVWLKVGGPGFAVFWMLMFGALALASGRTLTLNDRGLVIFAYLAIVSIVTTLIFCYVDLGLTNGRVTLFLGVILGVLAGLKAIDTQPGGDPMQAAAPAVATVGPVGPPPRPWSREAMAAAASAAAARAATAAEHRDDHEPSAAGAAPSGGSRG
jgi:hypothetical protein